MSPFRDLSSNSLSGTIPSTLKNLTAILRMCVARVCAMPFLIC